MKPIQSHRDLVAWQKAIEMGLPIYSLTKGFPEHEKFGLTSQIRRASVSVASNIAEGYGRGRSNDYLRFLTMARGSLCEIDTQLYFALRLGYTNESDHQVALKECKDCGRVLAGLIRSIEDNLNGRRVQD